MKSIKYILAALVPTLAVTAIVYAGSLTAPGTPSATFHTVDDIYNRLNTTNGNATTTAGSHSFTTPGSVGATFHTLQDIYASIPTIDATKVLSGTTYLGVAGSASAGFTYPSKPVKTGQTHCNAFTADYGDQLQIPCSGTKQDGDYRRGTATSTVDNNDGTITDNSTGLIWQKCSDGLSGSTCATGSATQVQFDDGNGDQGLSHQPALNYCENLTLGGSSEWRLPNVRELASIVNYGKVSPAIDTTYFPNTQSDHYWSSTAYEGYADSVWIVNFGDGNVNGASMANSFYVRCVRQNS